MRFPVPAGTIALPSSSISFSVPGHEKSPLCFQRGLRVFPIAWESSSFRLASITLRRTRGYAPRHNGGGVCIADVCNEARHLNSKTPVHFTTEHAVCRRECQLLSRESFLCHSSALVMNALFVDSFFCQRQSFATATQDPRMISATAFASAIVILLAVPGPTNSLLFLSGAERGFRPSLKLLFGEAAGYLSVVVPLATAAGPFFGSHPVAAASLKMVAAAWIAFLAFKLWNRPASARGTSSVSVKGIFITTLLNPKALVIGLTIMPSGSLAEILPWIGLFMVMLAGIAIGWIAAGAVASQAASSSFDPARTLSRLAAALLVGFSMLMTTSALTVLAKI